jgi:hypothetical protein
MSDWKNGYSIPDDEEGSAFKARTIRRTINKVQDDVPIGGKGYSRGDIGISKEARKGRAEAFDHVQNLREQDEEMYIERATRAASNRRK